MKAKRTELRSLVKTGSINLNLVGHWGAAGNLKTTNTFLFLGKLATDKEPISLGRKDCYETPLKMLTPFSLYCETYAEPYYDTHMVLLNLLNAAVL